MHYTTLGHTDIQVSRICLGTMTWGQQNSEAEAHAQLDRAIDAGINFIDTAELYPVPPKAETQGRTEAYIGSWLKQRGGRDQIVLASKVTGPAERAKHIRPNLRLDRHNIESAIETSLQRLQTDYLDLYQLHWPDRHANYFGQLGYAHKSDEQPIPIEETLTVLNDLVKAGKVRYVGISNETPWGAMEYLRLAEKLNLPRIVTVQNPYNLLNRTFEVGLAEIAHRENVGLLAYSPLGFGMLSGKYAGGAKPTGARLTLWSYFDRYSNPQALAAMEAYVKLARSHGISPVQMALAYVNSRPFLTANIIGATDMAQLEENIASDEIVLSDEILEGIEAIHKVHPNPSP